MSISPPPYRDKDLASQAWQKWFASIFDALRTTAAVVTSWASINKAGSNLKDLETRNHDDLQNLNTNTHVHLISSQYTGLTGGGITNLHAHDFSAHSIVIPGQDGEDGQDGMPGFQGIQGLQGIQGPMGFDGMDGEDGMFVVGPQGPQGIAGSGISIDQARAITTLRI